MRRLVLLLLVLGLGLVAFAYREATSDPIVRQLAVTLPDWPAGAPPVRALLLSDLHVSGPDMPPERVARIVAQANALRPDIVFLAGDFIGDKRTATRHYSYPAALAPLKALSPRLGSFAVLGNHDHWKDAAAARQALEAAGIRVLDNDAAEAGPIAIGGLDDAFTDHDDLPATLARMRALPGAKLVLSHSPDPFPDLPPDATLMLAGHTHCGQIVLPLIGPLSTQSDYGRRYVCGLIRERGRTLVVSAGLGTSILPLRLGAPPDMWLIEIQGRRH
jgi:predicted MPP superfamily phosphohydrolase